MCVMFRLILPALLAASPAFSQDLGACQNHPFSQKNCVRVLACIGEAGEWFDGRARGWDQGRVSGMLSDGTACLGTWSADGPLGTGVGQIACENGLQADVIYYNQDNETGTAIGRGLDSEGRPVRIWSGENVLQFLTRPGAFGPALPCVQGDIPIS